MPRERTRRRAERKSKGALRSWYPTRARLRRKIPHLQCGLTTQLSCGNCCSPLRGRSRATPRPLRAGRAGGAPGIGGRFSLRAKSSAIPPARRLRASLPCRSPPLDLACPLSCVCIQPGEVLGALLNGSGERQQDRTEPAAASREGAGFRLALMASRCPKPRRGEAVAPAPVGVPAGQGVSRRRSASPSRGRRGPLGAF